MAVAMFVACGSSSSSALLSPFFEIESRGRNASDHPSRAAISVSRSSSSMNSSMSISSSRDCFSVGGVDYGSSSSCASSSSSSSSLSAFGTRDGGAPRLSLTRSTPATASCLSGGVASRCAQLGWGASSSLGMGMGMGMGLGSGLDWSKGRALWRDGIASRKRMMQISAEKTDLTKVAGTVLRLGKQGFEVGTNLIPDSVPRPVARAGVGLASTIVASWLLRSLFSTLTFVLAIGAIIFAAYVFLTKGESGSSDAASSDRPEDTNDALDAARKIMDKYK